MFNVGPLELVAIALVALVVLGPERLPDAARKAGKLMGDLRQLSAGFQREVQQAFEEHGGSGSALEAVDTIRSITGGPLGPVRAGLNAAVASVSGQAKATMPVEEAPPARRSPAGRPRRQEAAARKKARRPRRPPPRKQASAKKPAPASKARPARLRPREAPAKKSAPAKGRGPAKEGRPSRRHLGPVGLPDGHHCSDLVGATPGCP